MTKKEIEQKYWAEFLIWYADYKDKEYYNGHRMILRPVNDLFWCWLVTEKDEDSNAHSFLKELLK